jgi:TraX protein
MNPTIFLGARRPFTLNAWVTLSPRAQDALKLLAVLSMVADHANRTLNPQQLEFPGVILAVFGRLAFPLFSLLIAQNLAMRSTNPRSYLFPLLIAGLISQWPFQEAINPGSLNVMFTLLLGVGAVAIGDWFDARLFKGAGLFGIAFAALLGLSSDYPLFGSALIPLAVILLRSRNVLAWIPFLAVALLTNLFAANAYVALVLPLIVFAASRLEGQRWLNLPYFGYWFYPAHLFALLLLKVVLR